MKDGKNKTIESLVIKGSSIVHKKNKDGKPTGPPLVLIPAGGLVYDATPLETHLPVGDRGVIFGHRAVLVKKDLQEETCRNFSVLAGRSFEVGDSVLTYLMPGPKGGPALLWRTLDGVSIRPTRSMSIRWARCRQRPRRGFSGSTPTPGRSPSTPPFPPP